MSALGLWWYQTRVDMVGVRNFRNVNSVNESIHIKITRKKNIGYSPVFSTCPWCLGQPRWCPHRVQRPGKQECQCHQSSTQKTPKTFLLTTIIGRPNAFVSSWGVFGGLEVTVKFLLFWIKHWKRNVCDQCCLLVYHVQFKRCVTFLSKDMNLWMWTRHNYEHNCLAEEGRYTWFFYLHIARLVCFANRTVTSGLWQNMHIT